MRESSTYQYILDEGRALGMQDVLLIVGRQRFGEPDGATQALLRSITDLDRLDRLIDQLLKVSSWQEWLATP